MKIKILIVAILCVGFYFVYRGISNQIQSSKNSVTQKDTENAFQVLNENKPSGVKTETPPLISRITEAIKPTIKVVTSPVVIVTTSPSTKIPSNNDLPGITMTTSSVNNKTLSKSNPVYITATIKDQIGGIAYVDLYVNGKKKFSIENKTNRYGTEIPRPNKDKSPQALEIAKNYIVEKSDEVLADLSYDYGSFYKFNTQNSECTIGEGYIYIMVGKKYLYDVRIFTDLEDVDICDRSHAVGFENNYMFLFDDDSAGTYKYYIKAYDVYGAERKGPEEKFILQ